MAEGDMKVDVDLQMKGLEEIEQALRKLKILLKNIIEKKEPIKKRKEIFFSLI